MRHDFRAHDDLGGVADVELTPYRSPFNALAPFYCANASFTARSYLHVLVHAANPNPHPDADPALGPDQVRNCSVVLQSACLAAAYAKDGVTEMRLGWDGGDTLQLYEGFSIVGYPQSYRWAERRVVEEGGG